MTVWSLDFVLNIKEKEMKRNKILLNNMGESRDDSEYDYILC
jgi:hypothetical protein